MLLKIEDAQRPCTTKKMTRHTSHLLLAGWDGGKEMYPELSLGNVFGNSWGGRCLVILYTKRDIIFHPVALHMC